MIFEHPPENFKSEFEVVTCYVIVNGQYLMVKRSEIEKYPNLWCAPGGKIEKGETKKQALIREFIEETSIKLDIEKLKFIKTMYVRYPEFDFIYNVFKTELNEIPKIILNDEQEDYVWVTPKEAHSYDLVPDEEESIRIAFNLKEL